MQSDIDPIETQEWIDALDSLIEYEGSNRANFLLSKLLSHASTKQLQVSSLTSSYKNTIASENEAHFTGDLAIEKRISNLTSWNAAAIVVRANKKGTELGGHIASFASSVTLYDVGFNHFFHGMDLKNHLGDLIYFQGHISPGIYARAFLEGRISENQLDLFRSETTEGGLSSYPHPWLMPDFWQFPTVSMGLGPLQAIYQARFMKYMIHRGILPEQNRKVWAFLGDGEMDEPESLGAITLAAREKLDNLIFVVNCNLQRLDGPVRGNGKIVQELASLFTGAGWNVIKCLWSSEWDDIFARDSKGALQSVLENACDGDFQTAMARGGQWTRENLFGRDPEALKVIEHLSDDELAALRRGGHDPKKVFAAYDAATKHKNQPTIILVKTVKGYGIGPSVESANVSHQVKKLPGADIRHMRDRFDIPVKDADLDKVPYVALDPKSEEFEYLTEKRRALGGSIPKRRTKTSVSLNVPKIDDFSAIMSGSQDRKISTTMAFNRVLSVLVKNKELAKHVVPIIPDESRTFGLEGMFRQLGIYSSVGQKYEPQDAAQIMYYKESKDGQILQEGINEGGAQAEWMAAATSYSNHDAPMIPFYIFYSMFGFQRVGDLLWASGDMQARGFLIGATAGRTTLNGEGLQHQDGHSHIMASTIPNCVSYDPTFSYEVAVIIQNGLKRMIEHQENVFYYITTMNENYAHPAIIEDPQCIEGILNGLYKLKTCSVDNSVAHVQLMGSGTILMEVIAAAEILSEDFNISVDVWSATSFNQLRKNGQEVERWNLLNPDKEQKISWVEKQLKGVTGPVIAATDYMKLYADQIRQFIPDKNFVALGTDGFGRSDSRQNLRKHFEVDRNSVVIAALGALVKQNSLEMDVLNQAMKSFDIDADKINPLFS